MTFDKPSLAIGIAILMIALLNRMGVFTDTQAFSGFIVVLMLGYATARKEVCRLRKDMGAA